MTDTSDRAALGLPLSSWLPSGAHPIAASVLLVLISAFVYGFYNAFLHPLRHYPGPLLWRAFRIPHVFSTHRGEIHKRLTEFHTKYGPVVRVAPNELSYASSRALKEIYVTRPGHLPFERNRTSFKKQAPTDPNSIVNWHEGDHARYKRAFANGFSEKILKEQAPIIESYVDLFMTQLKKRKTLDLEKWLNYLTFDISGDFTYGESWNCVANGKAHAWVDISQDFGKGLALIQSTNMYPPIDKLLRYIIPKRILQRSMEHRKMSFEQARKRIAMDTERPDWVTPTKKYSDLKDPFTGPEWGINLLVLAFAGSETSASALTAIIRSLVQHKGVLHRLTAGIRETFQKESDITVATTGNLTYLNAVISEGMRLNPPVVIGVPRIAPAGGDMVCDKWVPEGTYVAFNQFSAYRQSYNFRNPNSFMPERFLDPKSYHEDDMDVFHPFLVGRHKCVGVSFAWSEMRLILARLVWSFDIKLKDERDRWDWGEQCTYILWDKKPLEVILDHVNK